MSDRFQGYPKMSTPHGDVTLPVNYRAHLDIILRRIVGVQAATPAPVKVSRKKTRPRPPRRDRYKPILGPRIPPPNHHLWNNHGIWFLVYTLYPTPFTKERVRRSLKTHDVATARESRDAILLRLAARRMLAHYRYPGPRPRRPVTNSGAA